MTMTGTCRAMRIAEPGRLEPVELPIPRPGPGEVLIAVEACGICGADRSDFENGKPGRIPGHEVAGRIAALGPGAPSLWRIGQRVGVGRKGGHCLECEECRRGRFHLCRNQPVKGSSCDGGYGEMMITRATGLVAIPDELTAEEAAPILCAGIATFNAPKKSGAEAGDTVAILGIGGLGHMAVQYASRVGFRVVAIGGACALLATVGQADAIAAVLAGIAPGGRLVVLGAGRDPLPVSLGYLVGGERAVIGSITGSPWENERTLAFSVLAGVRPMIETMPLARAMDAYERMRPGEVKFRMVLTMAARDAHH